jgi:HD-like signal output (HDOD) protein
MPQELFRNKRFKPAQPPGFKDDDSSAARPGRKAPEVEIDEADILTAVDQLPSLPAVVNRILAETGSRVSSAADFEGLIRQDMAIAGRLLKLVNSPFYGLSHPVASITQGVAIIGFASLRSLVLAASTANLLANDLSGYGFQTQGLWMNSIATAGVARAVALRTGSSKDDAEEFFVAGLLRDIGMLVLGPFLSRHHLRLRRDAERERDILSRERTLLGYDHAWVGERIAEKWRLPPGLTLCIGKHHRIPTSASASQLRQLAVVRLAERLVYAAGIGVVPDHPFDSRLDGVLVQASGLDGPAFQSFMGEMPAILAGSQITLT